jgi:DNA-binding MarR family transcriptional regulator
MKKSVPDHHLVELAELVLRIAREIDPHGANAIDIVPLTGTEALVLRWIESHPGTCTKETCEAMQLKHSNASTAVTNLVTKGLVERKTDPTDRRLVRLHPTELARDNVARLHAHWAGRMRGAVGQDGASLEALLELLRRTDRELRINAS